MDSFERALELANTLFRAGEEPTWWHQLPVQAMLNILSMLPTRYILRLQRQWNESDRGVLRLIYENASLTHKRPAFFVQLFWSTRISNNVDDSPIIDMQSWIIEPERADFYKVPMPGKLREATGNIILCACKSIYCCGQCSAENDRILFTICNPSTNSWRRLVQHRIFMEYNFSAMAFDPSTRHCILVVGITGFDDHTIHEHEWNERGIDILTDIYDSNSNKWSEMDMVMPEGYGQPEGPGVYSNGRFYWSQYGGGGDLVALSVEEKNWVKISEPQWVYFHDQKYIEFLRTERPLIYERLSGNVIFWEGKIAYKDNMEDCYKDHFNRWSWRLSGTDDDRVVLINITISCVWELRKNTNEWKQLKIIFPGPHREVAMNSSGWTIFIGDKIYLYNKERSETKTIEYGNLGADPQSESMFSVWACEYNNIWWP